MAVAFPWELQKNREWRALFHVSAYVSLPQVFTVLGADCASAEMGSAPDGRRQLLVSMRYVGEDIETAYFEAHDLGEELADRLAFLSLAGADVSVASVTYPEVRLGATFEIALPVPDATRSPVMITVDDLSQFEKGRSDSGARAMRLFRTGAASGSSYHALGQLWAAAEVLGRQRAVADGNHVQYPCKSCGAVQEGQPRTLPYIAGFLEEVLEPKDRASATAKADAARATRGKVVHGGKLQDRTLRREVEDHLGHLQTGVAVALAQETGARTSILRTRRTGEAVMYAQIVAQSLMARKDEATVIANTQFGKWFLRNRGALPAIPKQYGREQDHQIAVLGLSFPLVVPNVCWPHIPTEPSPEASAG